jgi:hypothetical protein
MKELDNYSPKINIYQQLWRKFSKEKKPASALPAPKIQSQEDSIKWSLELQKTLDKKALKTGRTREDIKKEFTSGSEQFIPSLYPDLTRVHWGLAKVNMSIRGSQLDADGLLFAPEKQDIEQAKQDIEENKLYFDFDNFDELFLDESLETSVIKFD